VPIVLKSGSLNLLEPSGPIQACNGIALPLFTSGYHIQKQNGWYLSSWSFRTFEDETNIFFRNICRQLYNEAASQLRRTETSETPSRKPKTTVTSSSAPISNNIFSDAPFLVRIILAFPLPQPNPHSPHHGVL
jgi:hypothetical protein